ncbi:MAG: acyltransferase family protein [Bacteroidia bacterium]
MKKEQSQRISELDALRGIAALLVVFYHFTMGQPEARFGFKFGITGVDLFFIISGFVILLTLEKTKHWKDFILSRFSRIYPTYWACVTLTAILVYWTTHPGIKLFLGSYMSNMTMFQSYFGFTDIDGPYWTMIVEMLFYLFMLGVFITGQLKHIERIGIILLVPVFCYGYFLQASAPALQHFLDHRIPLINHFPLFVAGLLFYKIRFDKPSLLRYAGIVICFLVQLTLFRIGGRSNGVISFQEYTFVLSAYFLFFILYVNGALGFIVNRITLFLGRISYGLYLSHQYLALTILIPFLVAKTSLSHWQAAFFIVLPVELGLAALIHYVVEKPAMEKIRNWYKKRKEMLAVKSS